MASEETSFCLVKARPINYLITATIYYSSIVLSEGSIMIIRIFAVAKFLESFFAKKTEFLVWSTIFQEHHTSIVASIPLLKYVLEGHDFCNVLKNFPRFFPYFTVERKALKISKSCKNRANPSTSNIFSPLNCFKKYAIYVTFHPVRNVCWWICSAVFIFIALFAATWNLPQFPCGPSTSFWWASFYCASSSSWWPLPTEGFTTTWINSGSKYTVTYI